MEGTLEIVWENHLDRAATPKYKLFFLRYRNFKSGAQRPKLIVGLDGLESYLTDEVGFRPDHATDWMGRLHTGQHVSIPNVMMPEEQLTAYAN